jgi:ABC-type uncharacterized transport system auxiliary subunit
MKRRYVLGGALALAGCGLAERPYTERRQWPLLVPRPMSLPPRARGKVLQIRPLRAVAGMSVRGLQTLQPDGSLQVAFYEEWAVPPPEGVEDALRMWLAGSGLFSAVIGSGSRQAPDLVLEGELTALLADLGAGVARATLAVVVIDQHPNPARIRVQANETGVEPLKGTEAPAQVAAQLAALAAAFTETERALAPLA